MEFENRYKDTKVDVIRFYKKCVFSKYRMLGLFLVILGIIQIAIVLAISFGLVAGHLNKSMKILFFDMGACVLVFGVLLNMYHRIVGRIAFRKAEKGGGKGVVPTTVVTMADRIYCAWHSGIGEQKPKLTGVYDYENVMLVIDSDREYALMVDKMSGIRLQKGSFTEGKEEDFRGFIRARCKNAHWKKR